jgi:hypothetical protein
MRKLALFLAAAPLFAYSAPDGQAFLKTYCASCHAGKLLAGEMTSDRWTRIALRVRNSEMPPRNAPSPALNDRKAFINWVEDTLHNEACAAGPVAGHSPIRRLNRDEYTATVRELLNIHLNVGHDLPTDGAGGQGFDNAAEVLVLSPVLVEKYMDAAKTSLEYAVKDSRSRARIGIIPPDRGTKPDQAARNILIGFLPRAFRRPVTDKEMNPFLGMFREAQKGRQTFDASVVYMLRGVLMSPQFLFHAEMPNTGSAAKQLDDYALASRLSYFLWDSMPDEMLFDLAAAGKLHEPAVLKEVVARMLRSGKAMNFVESFVTQWLGTRELGREFVPDPKVFPKYSTDADLQGDIRFQPIVFFQSMVANNDPVTDLLDSKWTIGTKKLLDLYGVDKKYLRKDNQSQPHRLELPPGTDRGGLLGMSAVLAVSSYPYRTSPVLRGKWVLDSILGTPPLPPPPNVPALEEHPTGAQPQTIRERLAQHRRDPVCASCHSSIDPIGFALENYDALGQWRSEDAGKPVDSSGELPDGTKFQGALELKAVLLQQKDLFVRNLTNRMLGYALGRGLTRQDGCTVDSVIAQLKANDYKSQSLIEAIVMSPVFQLQKGTQFQKDSQFQKGTQ